MYNEEKLAELEENVVVEEVAEKLEDREDEEMDINDYFDFESKEYTEEERDEESATDDELAEEEKPEEVEAPTGEIIDTKEAAEEPQEETAEETSRKENQEPAKDDPDNMTEEEVEEDDDGFPDLDLGLVDAIEHPTKSAVGGNGQASDVTLVNTKKNGRRLVLKENVMEKLQLEETVQIGLINNTLVLGKEGIAKNIVYNLRKQGKTYIVYNTKLIKDITKALGLDFSSVTSRGLDIKYVTKNNQVYLMGRKQS